MVNKEVAEASGLKGVLSYQDVLDRLEQADRRLALAAYVVETLHPSAATIADDILRFCAYRYPGVDLVAEYVLRASYLANLQKRFDAQPRVGNLGGHSAVIPRDRYNISLLLSIVLTNHRFEIMQELRGFLSRLDSGAGRVASIGTGTGFELGLMSSSLLRSVEIESYDIDPTAKEEAQNYLRFFGIERPIVFGNEFPLDAADPSFENAFNRLILCEVLEHLPDPARALANVRAYLNESGHAFLTMAINIAQEDHIFLYADIESCRRQVRNAGLEIVREWIAPQTVTLPAADRESGFSKGNYVADTVKVR